MSGVAFGTYGSEIATGAVHWRRKVQPDQIVRVTRRDATHVTFRLPGGKDSVLPIRTFDEDFELSASPAAGETPDAG